MPTIIISENTTGTYIGTNAGVEETYINSLNATTNYGSGSTFQVQNNSSYTDQSRGLLRFTLPAALNGATISAVRLRLYHTDGGDGGNVWAIDVHESLRAWVEAQATYNIFSTGNNWATAGGLGSGDYDATVLASKVIGSGANFWHEITGSGLTDLVQAKATASETLLDLMLKPENLSSGPQVYVVFRASEGTDGQRPALEIDYTAAAGSASQDETVSLAETLAGIASTGQAQDESVSAAETITASITAGVQGSIISEPLKRNNGTLAASASLSYVAVYHKVSGELVLRKTGVSTNSLGVFAFTDAAVIQGVEYRLDWEESTGERRMPLKEAE